MSNKITAYKVTNLSKVNTTLYKEGDHFITNRSVGILVNGKIKTIGNDGPDLSDYAKLEDIPDVSSFLTSDEVQSMIPDTSEYVKADEVQAMIDDAINNLGGEGGE